MCRGKKLWYNDFREDIAMRNEPKTLWNRHFITILIFGFLTGTAGQMVGPLLSKYTLSLGAPLALASSLVGLLSGISCFVRPFAGMAVDRLNRKHMMMLSLVFYIIAYTGYRFFPYIPAVVISRIIQGIGASLLGLSRVAFATEFIPRDRMGEGVTLSSFGVVISQALGPGIGLWVADHWGFHACFTIALTSASIGLLLIALMPYHHTLPEKKREFNLSGLINVRILPYGVLAGMLGMITNMASSFVALLGDERNIPNVALFFTVYAVLAIILRPLTGRMLDRYGLSVQIYPAFLFAALGFLFLGLAQSLTLILLAAICKTLSQGVALPSIQGSVIKKLGREHAGVASATILIVQDAFCWLAPTVGGFVATGLGYTSMFCIFAGFVLLGIPIYRIIERYEVKHPIR